MSHITPIVASVLQSPVVQQQQTAEKSAHFRRQQELRRNIAAHGDQYQHAVESPEKIKPIHDERDEDPTRQRKQRRRPRKPGSQNEDPPPLLDVTA